MGAGARVWLQDPLSFGIKRPDREADNSPLPIAEFLIEWGCASSPPYAIMACTLTLLLKPISSLPFTPISCWSNALSFQE